MNKQILFIAALFYFSGLVSPVAAQKGKSEPKFLDDIIVEIAPVQEVSSAVSNSTISNNSIHLVSRKNLVSQPFGTDLEKAVTLQFKYALLLNTEVEQVKNIKLFNAIDEWYGTRYLLGGTTKKGIDCSALMQTLFASLYAVNLPRTAREQHKASRQISRTELKEGDLVFFNTRGGVSHVGLYLQNNKFLHASSSNGVMISDLYDEYWMLRYVGVGRMEGLAVPAITASLTIKP